MTGVLSAFGEGPQKIKDEDEKTGKVPVGRAREMMEYEGYLQEQQDKFQRLRGVSKTQQRLMELRGEYASKQEEPDSLQQEFMKRQLQRREEETAPEVRKDKSRDEKMASKTESKKGEPDLPVEPQLKSMQEEEAERRINYFYEMRLLVNIRNTQKPLPREKRRQRETVPIEEGRIAGTREAVLDDIPFLREASINPYAFESEEWEKR